MVCGYQNRWIANDCNGLRSVVGIVVGRCEALRGGLGGSLFRDQRGWKWLPTTFENTVKVSGAGFTGTCSVWSLQLRIGHTRRAARKSLTEKENFCDREATLSNINGLA